jgi:hypothetical protein
MQPQIKIDGSANWTANLDIFQPRENGLRGGSSSPLLNVKSGGEAGNLLASPGRSGRSTCHDRNFSELTIGRCSPNRQIVKSLNR